MGSKVSRFNVVDLFCGAGGLSCGLEMAGMRCLLGVDFDKTAMATFKRNHKHAEVFVGDISKLSRKKLLELTKMKKIHLVCGGPPCQGMSTVGEGIPDDPRNFLFLQFVRVVEILKPEYILMENVTGMLGRKNEHIPRSIISHFKKLGYAISVDVLSAHHYGVPQNRRRTIFIGNRLGYENAFPPIQYDGDAEGTEKARTVGEALKKLRAPDGRTYNHDIKAASIQDGRDKEIIRHIPEGRGIRYQEDEEELLPMELRLGVDWETMDEHRFRQTQYHRLGRKSISPTIMTGRHSYYHPVEDRYLTVREAAAIQSFPNDFVFEGTVSQQWRQVGNAVPPLLGKALGESIIRMHAEKKKAVAVTNEIWHVRSHAFDYKNKRIKKFQKTLLDYER